MHQANKSLSVVSSSD